jgi:hypothetical protein
MRNLFSSVNEAKKYFIGGNSTTTLKSLKTGNHFTYTIKASADKNVLFVCALTGQDNTYDYSYIGCLFQQIDGSYGYLTHTKNSKVSKDAPSFKAFKWAWQNIRNGTDMPDLEIWHEGRCGRCGRKLTEPDSIASGFGPICIDKI